MESNGMSHYRVEVTDDAKADLDEFVTYLLLVKKNEQAADSLLDDFLDAVGELEDVAGSLKLDDDKDLAALGYHRIHLKKHRYYLLSIRKIQKAGGTALVVRSVDEVRAVINSSLQ